jgi:D-alanyl-lipoteichoic acid acyltransferase DltB (MBOAT superfamily)
VFFRVLHLVIDAYQETLPDLPGPIAFVDYVLSFTAFVSGPIQLYPSYRTTESERATLDLPAVARAIDRIVTGFFKVSILSPIVLSLHDRALAAIAPNMPAGQSIALAAALVLVFPVYLYLNFSGYTDVVIGASRFLRLELPENFNRPFGAEGSLEFWGRWHMTLSNWLKTYVFSPFLSTLLRRFPDAALAPYLGVVAFFVTFFLVGIWHGSTSAFVLFGFMTGLGVSANKLYQVLKIERLGRKPYRALCARPLYKSLSRGLTFCWFGLSLTTFWSSVPELAHHVAVLGGGAIIAGFALAVAAASVALAGLGALSRIAALAWTCDAALAPSPLSRTVRVATLALVTASVAVVLDAPAPAIVYKGF